MNFLKTNEDAVSPIVATLVLIVVAVVGAVAVGTIMGTFSSDVAEQTNAGDIAGASASEILVAGSTTVEPLANLLADAYMDDHAGIKISVQGGGSGAGLSSVMMGISDIGMMSEALTSDQAKQYPDAIAHTIGKGAVVVVMSKDAAIDTISLAELANLYDESAATVGPAAVEKVIFRSSASGTADTFGAFLDVDDIYTPVANAVTVTTVEGVSGNSGMVTAVKAADNVIGFTDYSYAVTDSDLVMLKITDGAATYDPTVAANVIAAAKGDGSDYSTDLIRPLNLITNGEPNSVVKSFIQFCQTPAAKPYFDQLHLFSWIDSN